MQGRAAFLLAANQLRQKSKNYLRAALLQRRLVSRQGRIRWQRAPFIDKKADLWVSLLANWRI